MKRIRNFVAKVRTVAVKLIDKAVAAERYNQHLEEQVFQIKTRNRP